MADETVFNDDIVTISRKMENITANDSQQNSYELQVNKERISVLNTSPVNRLNECIKWEFPEDFNQLKLPAINLPEKILIVVDTAKKDTCTPFEFGRGAKAMPLQVIKRAIEVFIRVKGTMNSQHEYALMILKVETAELICEFTNNVNKLLGTLNGIEEIAIKENQYYDLDPCIDAILQNIRLENDIEYPSYVNRVILIYTRSNSIPKLRNPEPYVSLMRHKYFFFDALFVHEPLDKDDNCENVYSALSELDIKQNSWIFEVGRNAAQLHASIGKFLAHPLQRPKQDSADYTISINPRSTDKC